MASKVFPLRLPEETKARWQAAAEERGYYALAEYVKACVERDLDGGFRTKSGRILSDADIEALAAEAERGYDPATIVSTGRVAPAKPGDARQAVVPGGKVFKGPDPKEGKKK